MPSLNISLLPIIPIIFHFPLLFPQVGIKDEMIPKGAHDPYTKFGVNIGYGIWP